MGKAAAFLTRYVVVPRRVALVIAAWEQSAHFIGLGEDLGPWDQFPHLAIFSPGKRCAKTLLLEMAARAVPRPRRTVNISPAALYTLIEEERCTVLLDECQSISRRGSESSEVLREILNASVRKDEKAIRCEMRKDGRRIVEFSLYSPKIFAMIGEPDSVLADRSLPVPMNRKTAAERVERFRSRVVDKEGKEVHDALAAWAAANRAKVQKAYDTIEPFDIPNDRMADLLMPLQAVLTVLGDQQALADLKAYALDLNERDRAAEEVDPGLLLLTVCRELFDQRGETAGSTSQVSKLVTSVNSIDPEFLPTGDLIAILHDRDHEPWPTFSAGRPITAEAVGNLLRRYGIRSERNTNQTARGYARARFVDVWKRYLTAGGDTPPQPG